MKVTKCDVSVNRNASARSEGYECLYESLCVPASEVNVCACVCVCVCVVCVRVGVVYVCCVCVYVCVVCVCVNVVRGGYYN